MNPILRNILAVLAGCVVGMIVNMALIMVSGSIIAPPEGVDPTNTQSLAANIHLFQPKHFLMPFLAHALGTLVGAWVCAKIATTQKLVFGIGIGGFFLLGGIANCFMIPAPTWFMVVDLLLAYLPMGLLGGILAGGLKKAE